MQLNKSGLIVNKMKTVQMKQSGITMQSFAKLNLTFAIGDKLPDGYHEIVSIFQSISLADELIFEFKPDDGGNRGDSKISLFDTVSNTTSGFPLDKSNLINRSIDLFKNYTGLAKDLSITVRVRKNIPIAAGLAGGSGNAAATLTAINNFLGKPCSQLELLDLALHVGADVPFCLVGGTCIGRHKGEQLTKIAAAGKLHFVIAKPKKMAISTPAVYQWYDEIRERQPRTAYDTVKTDACIAAIQAGDPREASRYFFNAFESVVFPKYPQLSNLQKKMIDYGCLCANMTGSGPTMFGLAPNIQIAREVLQKLEADNVSLACDLRIAESVDFGVKICEPDSR